MSYYDLIECSVEDKIIHSKLEAKVLEMGISRGKLFKMIYDKLNPIEEAIRAEYEQTEEYKVHQEQIAILSTHRNVRNEFEKVYGSGTYNRIYDVFGNVRNKEYLEQSIATKGTADEAKKAQEEYKRRSEEEQWKRFDEYFKNSGGGSYSSNVNSNYNENEKRNFASCCEYAPTRTVDKGYFPCPLRCHQSWRLLICIKMLLHSFTYLAYDCVGGEWDDRKMERCFYCDYIRDCCCISNVLVGRYFINR